VYTWLNKQGVRSSLGFTVQVVSRFAIEYRDAHGAAKVAVEFAPGPPSTTVTYERRSFDSIPESRRAEAIENFRDAIKFMGSDPIESAT
jgi:hypothetical protein